MTTTAAAARVVPLRSQRSVLIALCFAAVFICYVDRVNISLAIVAMTREFGWNKTTSGFVMSSFFIGYLLTQVPGGLLAGRSAESTCSRSACCSGRCSRRSHRPPPTRDSPC
jgi:MFS family permease